MSPTTPMAPTACPALSWIGGGEARLAQHRLVALAREPALEDDLELAAQSRGGQRAGVNRDQRLLGEVVEHARRRVASIALPSAEAWAGSWAPTSSTWKTASGRKTWCTTTTAAPCSTPTRTAACDFAREALRVHERARPQLVVVEVGVAEMQQPRPELVLVGVAVLLDEAVRLERLQQAVDGRPRHAELVGELRDAEPSRAGGQRLQDPRRTVDGLDRAPPAAGAQSFAFGIVESASIA